MAQQVSMWQYFIIEVNMLEIIDTLQHTKGQQSCSDCEKLCCLRLLCVLYTLPCMCVYCVHIELQRCVTTLWEIWVTMSYMPSTRSSVPMCRSSRSGCVRAVAFADTVPMSARPNRSCNAYFTDLLLVTHSVIGLPSIAMSFVLVRVLNCHISLFVSFSKCSLKTFIVAYHTVLFNVIQC